MYIYVYTYKHMHIPEYLSSLLALDKKFYTRMHVCVFVWSSEHQYKAATATDTDECVQRFALSCLQKC